jgi:hypothetical protein
MTSGSEPREPGSPELQYLSHYVPFADSGSHETENPSLPAAAAISSPLTGFWAENKSKMEKNSNGDQILQIIYRWKALTEKNSLK